MNDTLVCAFFELLELFKIELPVIGDSSIIDTSKKYNVNPDDLVKFINSVIPSCIYKDYVILFPDAEAKKFATEILRSYDVLSDQVPGLNEEWESVLKLTLLDYFLKISLCKKYFFVDAKEFCEKFSEIFGCITLCENKDVIAKMILRTKKGLRTVKKEGKLTVKVMVAVPSVTDPVLAEKSATGTSSRAQS